MLMGEPSPATPNRPGIALQTAIGRLALRHASLAGRYLQHARSLHRLGGHLLQVISHGEGPYTGSRNIDPSQIADAMKRLDLAGLVAKPDRSSTEWVIADPRVAWAMGNQPAWIIPAPARGMTSWAANFESGELGLVTRLIDGATNEEIAERLGISRATVTRQLRRIYDKLGVSGRQEAVQQLRGVARSEDS